MTAIRRAGTLLRGLLAALVLVGLVAGVPALLVVTIGNPVPDGWSWTAPLTNGAILGVLASVAWVFWVQLVVCVVVELIAEIRLAAGRSADWLSRVPGTLDGQQALARTLVQAVVAIGFTGAAVGAASPWLAHADAASAKESAPVAAVPADAVPPPAPTAPLASKPQRHSAIKVEVERGDTLWSIAERHLGAGERWREIAEVNRGRPMADGSIFDDVRTILPGWILLVPATPATRQQSQDVTVERGDTLWDIADDEYGAGARWPRIYEANDDKIEDPHWIYPGQRLVVPGQRSSRPPPVEHDRRPLDPPITDVPPQVDPSEPGDGPAESADPTPEAAVPSSAGAPESVPDSNSDSADSGVDLDRATLARALLGGGGFLAAGMLAVYAARRLTQSRNRRSGRLTLSVATHLRAEEKALRSIGSSAGEATAFFDAALRELVHLAEDQGFDLPEAVAARLDAQRLDLHLSQPTISAPEPWLASPDGATWSVSRTHEPQAVERMSPYPTMVTLGEDLRGGTWLVDLEAAGVVQVVGDEAAGADVVRFVAAELALNPWSDAEQVSLIGIADEVVPLNHGRLFTEAKLDVERLAKVARQMVENIRSSRRDVLGSRTADWENAWVPTICMARIGEGNRDAVVAETAVLLDEMERTPGRTSVVLVVVAAQPLDRRALTLSVTADGDLATPWAPLRANRLTTDEAATLARMFDDAETDGDEAIPVVDGPDGEPSSSDAAGSLAQEVTEPRCGTGDPNSILPRPDRTYLEGAATTVEDLAVLAPAVPPSEAARTVATDPTLDADLDEWHDTRTARPRICVLGPIQLQAVGEKTREVESRPAYFAELAAYLSCHPDGLTPNEVAADFGIQNNTLHTRLGQLRKWLGKKPGTGEWYLPNAQRIRGQQVYRLDGVLADSDIFRRLRARGEARGPDGIEDFRRALELVAGKPYDQPRSKGYGWLVDTPFDHYLTAGIVDVAHVVATHALTEDNPNVALWAAEKAILAAPAEDKPRLDLVRAMNAMGEDAEAERYLRQEVFNRTDDDRAPLDPSERTTQVVSRFGRNGPR